MHRILQSKDFNRYVNVLVMGKILTSAMAIVKDAGLCKNRHLV